LLLLHHTFTADNSNGLFRAIKCLLEKARQFLYFKHLSICSFVSALLSEGPASAGVTMVDSHRLAKSHIARA